MDGEGYCIALSHWNHLGAALHPRTLFCQNKLAPGKITSRLRKQESNLNRKCKFAVEVLVKAVEIPRHILEQ
ncbi:hypothetical protein LA66_08255 [Aureimonas altamirensis]|uniref:Uncharacterized protein n=1 Tax=Aureimonas altamirensis TaxID=370622 RepID=A0A0B1Q1B4_9HYPH|nr:hypothetical protein LA66_08255 [Aureimonas altamirensis]